MITRKILSISDYTSISSLFRNFSLLTKKHPGLQDPVWVDPVDIYLWNICQNIIIIQFSFLIFCKYLSTRSTQPGLKNWKFLGQKAEIPEQAAYRDVIRSWEDHPGNHEKVKWPRDTIPSAIILYSGSYMDIRYWEPMSAVNHKKGNECEFPNKHLLSLQ